MKLQMLAVGKTDASFQTLEQDYLKKIQPLMPISVHTVSEERLSEKYKPQILSKEAQRLNKALKDGDFLIVCDERGETLSSVQFSKRLQSLREEARCSRICFAVGGALGLDPQFKQQAKLCLSLSPLTFTHQFARVLVLEQIYRALQIARGSAYHKD